MLTDKDKAFLRSLKWKWKDIELFEKELKENKVRKPCFIRATDGKLLAEVWKVGSKQCLRIL
jgi:hypothetical protein